MSRSRKKNPWIGNCGDKSEKKDKRLAHKSLRQAERRAIMNGDEIFPNLKSVSCVWTWNKDGKHMFHDKRWLRK